MARIIKFVHVLVIFLSLVHVAKNDDMKLLLSFIEEGKLLLLFTNFLISYLSHVN